MRIILEGNQIKTERDFHNQISKLLDFGEYYGNNLNALWDRLTTEQKPIFVVWKEHLLSKQNLGEECFKNIVDLFEAVKQDDISFHLKFNNDKDPIDIFNYSLE
ncbi:barstar family protein [Stenoxybacter acetivorans]|uniref:barstar family protein n=1 Tax=Stenoxybacter acetivorans TaxID=422441 RepID=UPI00068C27A1|nr:barstar family protein [Stenoxybacter acetivorans]